MSGYTKIGNTILEDLAKRRFNGSQYRILLAVLRYTFGFQRDKHEMSLTFLAEATGIDRSRVKKELNRLIEDRVINVVQEASFNSTRIIALNENLSEWGTAYSLPTGLQGANSPTGSEVDYTTGGELDYTTGGESDPQERKVKENFKEIDDDQEHNSGFVVNFNHVIEYEKFFGPYPLGRFKEDMDYWLFESQFKDPEAILCETIKRAAVANPSRPPAYIQSIVKNLHNLGLFTIEAVIDYNKRFDKKVFKEQKKNSNTFEQGEESKKRQAAIKELTSEQKADIERLEKEGELL